MQEETSYEKQHLKKDSSSIGSRNNGGILLHVVMRIRAQAGHRPAPRAVQHRRVQHRAMQPRAVQLQTIRRRPKLS